MYYAYRVLPSKRSVDLVSIRAGELSNVSSKKNNCLIIASFCETDF